MAMILWVSSFQPLIGCGAQQSCGAFHARRPEVGLAEIDAVIATGDLGDYPYAHAARADLLRRLGRATAARASYERALALTRQPAEQRFFRRRLEQLETAD
jgi:predicted RNA polymerase sigma factor